jgi:hypothetical protein
MSESRVIRPKQATDAQINEMATTRPSGSGNPAIADTFRNWSSTARELKLTLNLDSIPARYNSDRYKRWAHGQQ